MTFPGNSLLSAVDFTRYDTMSYSTANSDLLLDDHIYRHRPIVTAPPSLQQQEHQQQQQEHFASNTTQTTPLQRIQQTPATPPTNSIALQLQGQEMQATTTTHLQPQNVPQQCEETAATQLHTATAATTVFSSHDLAVENVMPGIYLTKNFLAWNEENLRSHGFTHIIIIDKHIQELYYPSPIFKLYTENTTVDAFDTYEYASHPACTSLKFGKEFEAIDLNFGEKSYLTTVLPNCYRAVKFINKASQAGGTILVIDCNGSEQKCLTIIVAYLMYKYNINFSKAFARLRDNYKKADLDRFYMTQLYEYEPILQVQRAQSRGQSCSREMNSAILKRKKIEDDAAPCVDDINDCSSYGMSFAAGSGTSEFFNTFNPLSNFNATTLTQSRLKATTTLSEQQQRRNQLNETTLQKPNIYRQHRQSLATAIFPSSDSQGYDDYAME